MPKIISSLSHHGFNNIVIGTCIYVFLIFQKTECTCVNNVKYFELLFILLFLSDLIANRLWAQISLKYYVLAIKQNLVSLFLTTVYLLFTEFF